MGYTVKIFNNVTGEIATLKKTVKLRASAEHLASKIVKSMVDELEGLGYEREAVIKQIKVVIKKVSVS